MIRSKQCNIILLEKERYRESRKSSQQRTNDIGYYLNNEYYETISNEDYILDTEFFIGTYENNNEYSYLNTYANSITGKVGLYKIGDFFISDDNDIYTLTPSNYSSKVVYTIKNNRFFIDFVTSEYKIKPVLSLDGTIFILKGDGTKNNPYEIGR